MSEPSSQMVTLLTKAAVLRAYGKTWEVVATECGRAEGTVRHWPQEHRELFRQLYQEASERVWDEAEAEARLVQRELLRSNSENIQQSAAHSLMACARAARPNRTELTGKDGTPLVPTVIEAVLRHAGQQSQDEDDGS